MRISSYAVARPAYYDRNATSTVSNYAADLSPHGGVDRFTYTVASGKKMLVEAAFAQTVIATAPTTAARVALSVELRVGATTIVISAVDGVQSSTVGASSVNFATTQPTLYAGEIVAGRTYIASTGGTVNCQIAAKGTVYDA